MSFDAQDDYFIAKLLVSDGEEVVVGVPIMITVEDESSVAAFANYVVPSKAAAPVIAAAPAAPVVAAAPVHVSPPIVHAPAPQAVAVAATPMAPAPVVTATVVKPSTNTAHSSGPLPYSVRWSTGSVARSAIASKLSSDQQAYIAKYGRSGQKAL